MNLTNNAKDKQFGKTGFSSAKLLLCTNIFVASSGLPAQLMNIKE